MQMKTFLARRENTGGWLCTHTHKQTDGQTDRHPYTYTHTIMLTRFAWKINSAIRFRLQRLDSFLELFGSNMKNCTRHALISNNNNNNTCTYTNSYTYIFMYVCATVAYSLSLACTACVCVCVCFNCGGKERLMYCAHIRQC